VALRSSLVSPPEVLHFPINSALQNLPCAKLSGFNPDCINVSLETQSAISSDQHPVQYWLIRPAQTVQPAPVLLWIHGGPMSAWQDEWHWRWNAMVAVAQGYALVLPNPRGSTGFGQAFTDGVWRNTWGQQCYEDILAVLDHIAPRSDLDVQRMAAMGGSFGGYMINWLATQTTRFKCLISHAGIYSMSSMAGVTDHPAFWYLAMDGEPYSDPAWFDRYSPSRGVGKWRTPTLIIHGERDYRVPISEALALFEALQYHHVDSELLVFPDENHWICKPNNIKPWYQSVFDFLQRHG
jgi:dipeptidyl aminopeptidase/acylaminoacyl peptidase